MAGMAEKYFRKYWGVGQPLSHPPAQTRFQYEKHDIGKPNGTDPREVSHEDPQQPPIADPPRGLVVRPNAPGGGSGN
jgi:hypothetical protein